MSKKDDFLELVHDLLDDPPEYDVAYAVCKECEKVQKVETPQVGMIKHCENHPPLSNIQR